MSAPEFIKKLQALGIETLRNDPPLAEERSGQYVDLDTIIEQCNFITMHVPLTRSGVHATQHLFDKEKLTQLQKNCLLVNAARGPVIDNKALLEVMAQRPDLTIFLDTWEDEPEISRELLGQS